MAPPQRSSTATIFLIDANSGGRSTTHLTRPLATTSKLIAVGGHSDAQHRERALRLDSMRT
jgi:hypothetical protein